MDLWTFLERRVERTPDKILLRYHDLQQAYAEFRQSAAWAASALRALGVRQGDTVCVMLGNSPDFLHIWFGLARLGAIIVPINIHLKGDGLSYIVDHSEATIVIAEADLASRLQEATAGISRPLTVVARADGPVPPRCLNWRQLIAAAGDGPPEVSIRSEATCAILYTSGTTGPPKGVMLSHRAYLNSAEAFADEFVGATQDDVLYTSLPLFHINAQAHTALPAIARNATMAIGDRFSASGFWDELRFHGATIFNSLAAMIPILCKQPHGPDDRNHRARLTACAATPRDVWLEFEERFGVRIIEGYGLTETAGFCLTNPRDAVRLGSIGKPMTFVEARVVDGDDQPVRPGTPGEIAIRANPSDVFMGGYYHMPEQTAEAMRGGWFHSGDLGFADGDGYFSFVDRIKQSIRRRGENISSWEVEKAINAHSMVLESAAVGVPSELGEEEVKVYVVLRPNEDLDPAAIVHWCEERLAYFMVPRYVEFRDSLPKTATERLEKYKLKQEGIGAAWDRDAAGIQTRRN